MSVSTLHNEAMEIAVKAFSEKRIDSDKATGFFQQAFELEKKAAFLAKEQNASEKTVSILLRSAATLAFHSNNYTEAESLVNLALSGEPPFQIKEELNELLENVKKVTKGEQDATGIYSSIFSNMVAENKTPYQTESKGKSAPLIEVIEDTVIQKFKKGDPDALRFIFDSYSTVLLAFVNKLIDDNQLSEDIVSEAFIKLWGRHDQFNSIDHIKAFVFISARNASLNFLRQTKRRIELNKNYSKTLEDVSAIPDNFSDAGLMQSVYNSIEKLPPKTREVFELIYIKGLSTKEVGDRLNITERNVLNQKNRAIQLLKEKLLL